MKIEMMVSSFLFGLKALVNSTDKMYMLNYWPVLILVLKLMFYLFLYCGDIDREASDNF